MLDRSLVRYGAVAVVAAVLTIGLKGGAYLLTGSVGLLSDAIESLVNLLAAITALVVLAIAARPADEDHAYGHTKVEYFASGFEGALILVAALSIVVAGARRLIEPQPLESVSLGLSITAVASGINLLVARVLAEAGRRYGSITLEAGAKHLMADVWTSLAVIVGVGVAAGTGVLWLDPLVGMAVAINIVRTGFALVRRSLLGLLDTALPEEVRREIAQVLDEHRGEGVRYHALRTRQAGAWRFVSFHILVPGEWTVQRGHDLLERIEARVREVVPNSTVFTHLEPLEDPLSWEDTGLERREGDA